MPRFAGLIAALLVSLAAPAWAGDEQKEPAEQQQAEEEHEPPEREAPALDAAFLGEGTWATEQDCHNLRALEGGASYRDVEPARLVTSKGSKYVDQTCTYAAIDAQPGGAFRVKAACRGGCDSFTETLVFTPLPKGGYAMSFATDSRQHPLVRCEPKPKEVQTN